MAVPTWSPITDAEIQPEQPVSSSLITRLRNQWASVWGVDPASVSQPAISLPPSQIFQEFYQAAESYGTGAGVSTFTEFELMDLTKGMRSTIFNSIYVSSNDLMFIDAIYAANPKYTAGVISDVTVVLKKTLVSTTSYQTIDIPVNNSYTNIMYSGPSSFVAVKIRVSGDKLYMQFQSDAAGGAGSQACIVSLTRGYYVNGGVNG